MTTATNPTWKYEAIVTSDVSGGDYAGGEIARAIYIGDTAGGAEIVIVGVNGLPVTFEGVIAGTWLPVRHVRVNTTGTTAAKLVALF